MKLSSRRIEQAICALGLLALGALVLLWLLRHPGLGLWPRLAALLSAGLFAALGLRFVPGWVAFWSPGEDDAPPPAEEPPHMGLRIVAALLGWDLAVLLLAWLLRGAMGSAGSFRDTLSFWLCTDSRHYIDIARDWYLSEGSIDRLVQLVFLPGYPVLVRLLAPLCGGELTAGLLVSALCYALAGWAFYRLLRLDHPHETALRALLILCLLPGSFFFAAPMSESLFLLSCCLCLLLWRKGRFGWACLCGGWAAFTRSLGLTLLVPLIMELVHSLVREKLPLKTLLPRCLALLLVPAGFGGYCLVNYLVSGDPLQFLTYQSEHWHQHLGLFFHTASYQTELALSSFTADPPLFWGLWLPNLLASLASLAMLAGAAKRLRPSYGAWAIAYYVIAIGATWLLSAPRYLLALPVLPLSLALLTEKKSRAAFLLPLLAILWTLYFLAFLLRWQVW